MFSSSAHVEPVDFQDVVTFSVKRHPLGRILSTFSLFVYTDTFLCGKLRSWPDFACGPVL